jgi:hypothetical protein
MTADNVDEFKIVGGYRPPLRNLLQLPLLCRFCLKDQFLGFRIVVDNDGLPIFHLTL